MAVVQEIIDRQNPDGGWNYQRGGSSWTEPACYALLSLGAGGRAGSDAAQRGARWLASQQRADGGWAPKAGVEESTWVTALVLLLPAGLLDAVSRERAAAWLVAETGRESSIVQRLRARLLGVPADPAQAFDGWPWFPGAAAWVAPTALSILALERLEGTADKAALRDRLQQGRSFLLARRCRDGGWNHGSTKALGYDSDSYPETTGLALLALHGSAPAEVVSAMPVAERHLASCNSLEAASWLTLALAAHGRLPATRNLPARGGTIEIALSALASFALEGRNVFLES